MDDLQAIRTARDVFETISQEISNTSETTTSSVPSNLEVIRGADALAKAIRDAEITMKASPSFPAILTALNDLSISLRNVCKYDAAERICRQVLEGREKILGPEHIDTLNTVDGLATVLILRNQHKAAEKMFRRALTGREKESGSEHIDTLATINGIALVLMYRGQNEKAEEMFRRALKGREKTLGFEHIDTLTTVNGLARVLIRRGQDKAAEKMFRRALEGREKILGPKNIDTLTTVNGLATVLMCRDQHKAAEEMFRQALEGREKILGPEHIDTLATVNGLATVLMYRSQDEAAEKMFRRALEGREKISGPEHIDTLVTVNGLATVLMYRGQDKAAEEMYRRALKGREKILGPEHIATLATVNGLAWMLVFRGQDKAAEEMFRRALKGREKILGPEHIDTLITVNGLATVLMYRGQDEAAEEMFRRALKGREKILGPEHIDTLATLEGLAEVLQSQRDNQSREAADSRGHDVLHNPPPSDENRDHKHETPTRSSVKPAVEMSGAVDEKEQMYEPLVDTAAELMSSSYSTEHIVQTSSSTSEEPEMTESHDSETGDEILSEDDEDDRTPPTEYESPLMSLKDRIAKPKQYFSQLSALVLTVLQHSTVNIYSTEYSFHAAIRSDHASELCARYPEPLEELVADMPPLLRDSDVIKVYVEASTANSEFVEVLRGLLESRNVIAKAYLNLRRLQLDGFCSQKFNVLVADPDRNNVARLLPIDIEDILLLVQEIESVLRKIADFIKTTASLLTSSSEELFVAALGKQENLLASVPRCSKVLGLFGLPTTVDGPSTFPFGAFHSQLPMLLRMAVHTIDLAVLSYAGAHLDRFDEDFLGEDIAVIDVLSPFADMHGSNFPSIKLRRCSLQCLDSFHSNHPVWVFSSSDWQPQGSLFLSSDVDVFADIWGPLWKAVDPEKPEMYTRYVVGNGSIFKWRPTSSTPSLYDGEVLCHWVSDHELARALDPDQDLDQLSLADHSHRSFDGRETMLIGAVAAGCETLFVNGRCNLDVAEVRAQMQDEGRLRMLGVVQEHKYKDSETYQLQVGHSGVNATAARQYKRRGQSLKKALVELWAMAPEIRDPQLLEDFYGLEVSPCTNNAQRVQLGRILGFKCMRRYLRTFTWKDDCKRAYFEALQGFRQNKNALQQLWEVDQQYRSEFGQAIMVCLKALEKTGVNHNKELDVFMSSEITARPELATLKPKEHSWIGLLKETVDSCCMAVFGDDCLKFDYETDVACGGLDRSVLRTALVMNRLNRPNGLVKKYAYRHEASELWASRWSVSAMEVGSDIWMGEHGTLRLLSHLPEATLVMEWRASQMSTAIKNLVGKEKPHREFIEFEQGARRPIRPLPVFVMAHVGAG